MSALISATDAVHWYLEELTSKIIAESGIPSDRYHIGKAILQSLKDSPDFVLQTDAATGKSENFKSVFERSVKCAISLKKMGFKKGDVIVVMAPNHLDVSIVLYAALYLGIIIATMDIGLELFELKEMFQVNKANLIVCQSEKIPIIKEALNQISLKAEIIAFDESSHEQTFSKLLKDHGDVDLNCFKPENIDPKEAIAFLLSTSGTTGLPKVVALTHKNLMIGFTSFWLDFSKFPTPTKLVLNLLPIQWGTSILMHTFAPILRNSKVHTSNPLTQEHFVEIVNKYRPTYAFMSPTLLTSMIKFDGVREKVDLMCFEYLMLGGSAVSTQLIDQIKKLAPNVRLRIGYGSSESGALAYSNQIPVRHSIGRPIGFFDYRLVDVNTYQNVTEPHVEGELWLKGPTVFKGYYNNPEYTKEVLLDDGWLRTGDIFYRDEQFNFYFVDRLKLLLKYKSYQISPSELEKVIYQHPGVLHVAVTSVQDEECGDLPVACVVTRSGHDVTAQEIKDLVKETLSDPKQLRGGVIFMKELPLTISTKFDRSKLKKIVKTMERQ